MSGWSAPATAPNWGAPAQPADPANSWGDLAQTPARQAPPSNSWGTSDMAAALPDVSAPANPTPTAETTEGVKNPQDHGWTTKQPYDYNSYNKSNKEYDEERAAANAGAAEGAAAEGVTPLGINNDFTEIGWASDAALYNFPEGDLGEIGPEHHELEKILFGSEFQVRSGIKFDRITKLDVTQEGSVRIAPIRNFKDAGLHPAMLKNVQLAGYDVPTPIQQYCLPAVFKGHDVVACAQTGSGKTAAFLIPILSKLMGKAKKLSAPRPNPATFIHGVTPPVRAEPLVLIVCPSRELATQIFNEARRFCYRSMLRPAVIYGGGPVRDQAMQLAKGCDVLIGTPGRLCDFISKPHILTLRRLKYMVIDEADEMLHSDWEQELQQIMSGGDQEEGNINYLMFSATFPKIARDLAKEHLAHDHVRIRVGRAGSSHVNIKQDIVFVEPHMKRQALVDLLLSTPPARTIIFVNSKRSADELDDFLFNREDGGFPCVSIHSDRTQREREDCIRAFRNGKAPILIATGVSARGLDIHNVMHVINYDLPSPQFGGIEEYTHRIGRTGRIGNMGLATSFYNEKDADLAELLTKTLLETQQVVPDFLMSFIPEGFAADGSGDPNLLKFEADSDDGEENAQSADSGAGGWGVTAPAGDAPAAPAWGAPATEPVAAAPAATPGFGAQAQAPITSQPAPATSSWGSQAPVAPGQQATPSNSWGAPTSGGWNSGAAW